MRYAWVVAVAWGCGFSAPAVIERDDAGTDAFVDPYQDASGTGVDASVVSSVCLGPTSSVWSVCISTVPLPADVALPPEINTDDDSAQCLLAQPTGWRPAQPSACFIVANNITGTGTTKVRGKRPLVLVALETIQLGGTLDVASERGNGPYGPGSPGMGCGSFAENPDSEDGRPAGGGAGGSFGTIGGGGGSADENEGGEPNPMQTPTLLRGGCPGQQGANNGGPAGRGGGAVYLVAGTSITITGSVNASGAGASGEDDNSGGSGGGSGGMIVLHAPAISASTLFANGGGGSAGGEDGGGGGWENGLVSVDGAPGDESSAPASPGEGGSGPGGPGGDGFAGTSAAGSGRNGGNGGSSPTRGGGGGGGGGGGFIGANIVPTGAGISPPAVTFP